MFGDLSTSKFHRAPIKITRLHSAAVICWRPRKRQRHTTVEESSDDDAGLHSDAWNDEPDNFDLNEIKENEGVLVADVIIHASIKALGLISNAVWVVYDLMF